MKRRTTLWLALLVLFLASVLYIIDHNPERQDATLASSRVFDLTTEPITMMGIVRDGVTIEMVRKDEQWFLQSPIRARASGLVMHRLEAAAERLRRVHTYTAEQRAIRNLSLEDYGLHPAEGSFFIEAGGRRETISFGGRAPFGGGIYGLLHDSDTVVVLPEDAMSLISPSLDDLRDRSLFSGSQRRVNRVDIYRHDLGFLQLVRRGGRWHIQQPLVWPADSGAVQQLLDSLYVMQVQRFVWDAPADSEDGLQSPAFRSQVEEASLAPDQAHTRITVWVEGSETGEELFLGNAHEGDGQLYARRWGVPSVFTVPSLLGEIASAPVYQFRDRRVLLPEWEQLRALSLRYQDQRLVLTRQNVNRWSLSEPVRNADMVRSDAVDALMRELMQLRIDSFDPVDVVPAETFIVEAGFSTDVPDPLIPRVLQLGFTPDEDSGLIHWYGRVRENEPFLRMTGFQPKGGIAALFHPARYRSRWVLAVDEAALTWIQQTTAHGEITLRRQQDEEGDSSWQLAHPADRALDRDAYRLFLAVLRRLQAAEVVDFQPLRLTRFGLHAPVATITLRFTDPDRLQQSLLLGVGAEDDAIYARLQGQGYVFRLQDEDANILKSQFLQPLPEPSAAELEVDDLPVEETEEDLHAEDERLPDAVQEADADAIPVLNLIDVD